MASLVMGGRGATGQAQGRRLTRLMAVLLPLCGCAGDAAGVGEHDFTGIRSVKFQGQNLAPEAALGAMRRSITAVVANVPPVSSPMSGSVRIVVPDYDRLRVLAIQRVKPPSSGTVNFVAAQEEIGTRAMADAVVQSRVFATSAVVEHNDTAMPDAGRADYLLWYQVASITPNNAGPWIGRWLLRRPGAATSYPVNPDPGTAAGVPRLASFVQSVRLVAAAPAGGLPGAAAAVGPRAVSGGSGIVVDAQGHILTNNHVIAGCPDVRVATADGSGGTAVLMAGDAANDLALLKTERRWPAWAKFRDSRGLRPGEPLVVTGFPLPGTVSPEMAVTTGSLTALAGLQGDTRQLQFSAPVQPGNSGGPVLDDSGRVVGVASSVLTSLGLVVTTGLVAQNANFAIKSDAAREFLDTNRVSLDQGAGRSGLSAPAIGDLARKFTVKVECWR